MPRELERAGALCLAFANTATPARDDRRRTPVAEPRLRLESYDELLTWALRMGALEAGSGDRLRQLAKERPEEAAAVVAGARRLRSVVMRVFTAVSAKAEPAVEDLATLNAALRVRKVVRAPGGFRWAEAGDPEALDLVLSPVAQSAGDLLTSENLARLRQCGAPGCTRLFVYRSRRRLWCDMNLCGNRLKSRRHHQRLKR